MNIPKERPILFTGLMMGANLEDRKGETRRVVKGAEEFDIVSFERWLVDGEPQYRPSGIPLWISTEADGTTRQWGCPYGEAGDRLWCRETFFCNSFDYPKPTDHARENLYYRASGEHTRDCEQERIEGWKPSIHMPRWASRLTLEVVDIRAERLQAITDQGAKAEGIFPGRILIRGEEIAVWHGVSYVGDDSPVEAYITLWEEINNPKGYCAEDNPVCWDANPWVFVVSYRKIAQEGI